MVGKSWKTIAQEKQAERRRLISATIESLGESTSADDQFILASASQIVKNIGARKDGWTAENVMRAYIRRAAVVQEKINCVTEVLFAQALGEARALDVEFEETKTLRGPLHGVPISLKDLIQVKGYDACIGFTAWAQKPCDTDADIVKQIRAAGGVPFVKTNVPQTMLAFSCGNPVFGKTLNPYSEKHTCGGSSGGEGALLAMDGSALGYGNDVGGSLRIPASFSGIYSLKPGEQRYCQAGGRGCTPGFEAIRTSMGPMARCMEDIELSCRVHFGQVGDDVTRRGAPVPYREVKLPKKLKIGYYKSDGLIRASPPVQRAVQEAVDALRNEGHDCIEFAPPNILECARIFASLTSADKYETLTSWIGDDPRDPSLFLVTLGSRIPAFVRRIVMWSARMVYADEIFGYLMKDSRGKSVKEYWAETNKRNEYCEYFHKEAWQKHGFDGIIGPVNALPSMPHEAAKELSPLALTTAVYNVLHYPVGVVPVTRTDRKKDGITPEWESSGSRGSGFIYAKLYEGKNPAFNVEDLHGVPVGVQVVGKPWEEEKVIEMMKVLDSALGPREVGIGSWKGRT